MKRTTFTLMLFLILNIGYSTDNNIKNENTYNEFVTNYTNDDVSKAIIDLFFMKNGSDQLNPWSHLQESENKYSNKNLIKTLKRYHSKKVIDQELQNEIDDLLNQQSEITKEGYNHLIKATLEKMDE